MTKKTSQGSEFPVPNNPSNPEGDTFESPSIEGFESPTQAGYQTGHPEHVGEQEPFGGKQFNSPSLPNQAVPASGEFAPDLPSNEASPVAGTFAPGKPVVEPGKSIDVPAIPVPPPVPFTGAETSVGPVDIGATFPVTSEPAIASKTGGFISNDDFPDGFLVHVPTHTRATEAAKYVPEVLHIRNVTRSETTGDITIIYSDGAKEIKKGVSIEDYRAFEAQFQEPNWQVGTLTAWNKL